MAEKRRINGRRKGHQFERDQAKIWGDWWGNRELFARTPMSGGWKIAGDIACTDPDFPFTLEMKKHEGWFFEQLWNDKCEIFAWLNQVQNDVVKKKAVGKIPMVVFTKNCCDVYVMVSMHLFLKMADYFRFENHVGKMRFKKDLYDVMIIRQKDFLDIDVELVRSFGKSLNGKTDVPQESAGAGV